MVVTRAAHLSSSGQTAAMLRCWVSRGKARLSDYPCAAVVRKGGRQESLAGLEHLAVPDLHRFALSDIVPTAYQVPR